MTGGTPAPAYDASPSWLSDLVEAAQETPVGRRHSADGAGRRSAVLILFAAAQGTPASGPVADPATESAMALPDVLLLERAHTLRSHAGQVAFPGGALDPDDAGPEAAALREAEEETGLEPAGVTVVGRLPDLYIPPSDYLVTPVVGWWRRPTPVRAVDLAEVASVHRVPVGDLVDPERRFTVRLPNGYRGPAFWLGELVVWGFTGGLLDQLFTLAGWARPWDHTRVEELPPRQLDLIMAERAERSGRAGRSGGSA